jgi:3'-phosphoadenosine 5'-phosphosulfate (PAPS) 3'-phosphatase
VCIYLAEKSGNIIREVYSSKDLGTTEKDMGLGPVTIADLRVQRSIEYNLKRLYPTLNVQGEEDPSIYAKYEPTILTEEITKGLIKQDFLNAYHAKRAPYLEQLRTVYTETSERESLFETFDTKDAVVWIDPLDGTNDFVKGNLPAVTVLIGLSLGGHSRIGVVHNPFSDED